MLGFLDLRAFFSNEHSSDGEKGIKGKSAANFDISKIIMKHDYFSDINPRSIRRLINIVAIQARLLRWFLRSVSASMYVCLTRNLVCLIDQTPRPQMGLSVDLIYFSSILYSGPTELTIWNLSGTAWFLGWTWPSSGLTEHPFSSFLPRRMTPF